MTFRQVIVSHRH